MKRLSSEEREPTGRCLCINTLPTDCSCITSHRRGTCDMYAILHQSASLIFLDLDSIAGVCLWVACSKGCRRDTFILCFSFFFPAALSTLQGNQQSHSLSLSLHSLRQKHGASSNGKTRTHPLKVPPSSTFDRCSWRGTGIPARYTRSRGQICLWAAPLL